MVYGCIDADVTFIILKAKMELDGTCVIGKKFRNYSNSYNKAMHEIYMEWNEQ